MDAQVALIEYQDPQYVLLAEILCPTSEKADSLYAALENGKNFDELASMQAAEPGFEKNELGNIDIRVFPPTNT